ncbi:MAG: peroxide stress protein YaaA, partial [Lysobacteraceae bacterium]
MLFLLSPAKSLDYETPVEADVPHTLPPFVRDSAALIELLRQQTPAQLSALMSISDPLAALNAARYEA